MDIEIKNGTVVSKIYSDGGAELLAVFQCKDNADSWAEYYMRNLDNGASVSLYRTCLYSGKSKVFYPLPNVPKQEKKDD